MRLVFALLLLVTISCAVKWHELDGYTYDDYVKEFGRQHSNEVEMINRRKIFDEKLAKIHAHNADSTKTWKLGVNQFTDRTEAEFRRVLGLRKDILYRQQRVVDTSVDYSNIDISAFAGVNVDWRDQKIITAVKDQGQCGSCWTFATAETLESYWAKETGQLTDLSEQQILDCTPNPNDCGGTGGCEGGTAELAYAQIQKQGGLATEWTYPYLSYQGADFKCNFSGNTRPLAKVSGYVNLPANVYAPVLQHIATVGPLAISVDASSWGAYETGVFDGCNQVNPDIDHAVQLVGVGTDSKLGDYWLVRNSWGPVYGEGGYIRLRRTETVRCGIDKTPSDGDGCNGGPTQVTVCGTCGILFDVLYPNITVSYRN